MRIIERLVSIGHHAVIATSNYHLLLFIELPWLVRFGVYPRNRPAFAYKILHEYRSKFKRVEIALSL